MWGKRADMVVHYQEPFNAESPTAVLAGQPVTPVEAFYSRNQAAGGICDSREQA